MQHGRAVPGTSATPGPTLCALAFGAPGCCTVLQMGAAARGGTDAEAAIAAEPPGGYSTRRIDTPAAKCPP